jgi:hypothetical protein
MVSDATRSAAGGISGVDWGERELHWLRNVSEPVGTYLASRCDERRPLDGARTPNERPRTRRWLMPCRERVMRGVPA